MADGKLSSYQNNKSERISNSKQSENNVSKNEEDKATKWGLPLKELYRLALKFYKEKDGKAFNFSYEDKLKLVALTQQVSHGKYSQQKLPPLGAFDVIGRDRRLAWQALGDASKVQAMDCLIELVDEQCPLFKTFVDAYKADLEERDKIRREGEIKKKKEQEKRRLEEEMRLKEEQELLKQESQRRQVQEALNQQTFMQFKTYAEQQYPGNPEQQAVLVRQLQDQHYHQYMQQLLRTNHIELPLSDNEETDDMSQANLAANGDSDIPHEELELESEDEGSSQTISMASMWTRKDLKPFKDSIKKEGGDSIIRVGHGETVTVIFSSIILKLPDDVERANLSVARRMEAAANRPPLSIIVPVFRRDCQDEVYAGSHSYPGQGVYLLKFDNSYSLWRSKTLYYRVYYTR
ncbi:Golgi resident protein GCP60 [Nilaparvata lugens]|uniref:Golgi resident protein GCP60 n=1 Tax=Nilaparvata lugens TaxID=108931 RepID=UPI00193D5620|nr:Golgi resident protein GCP60 [Nilaparvata lugens]